MALLTVFSDILNPQAENLSVRFTNAVGFYIHAPLLSTELEIDVFLQVYLPNSSGERVRNIPLGKIEEQAILLNVTDTETLITIPTEYVDSNLEMALLFLTSDAVYLEVYIVGVDCSLCEIRNRQINMSNTLIDIQIMLNQILAALNIPALTTGTLGDDAQFMYIQ